MINFRVKIKIKFPEIYPIHTFIRIYLFVPEFSQFMSTIFIIYELLQNGNKLFRNLSSSFMVISKNHDKKAFFIKISLENFRYVVDSF